MIEKRISLHHADDIINVAKMLFVDIMVADNSLYDGFVITADCAIKVGKLKTTKYILIVPTDIETEYLLVLTNNQDLIVKYFGNTSFTNFWKIA